MSIVRLQKLRLVGHTDEREAVLRGLQEIGCVMPLQLRSAEDAPAAAQPSAPKRHVYEALEFLLSCKHRRKQVSYDEAFDAEKLQVQALELKKKLQALEDERDALVQRKRDLAPFGEFTFPKSGELGGMKLWFYSIPAPLVGQFEKAGVPFKKINSDPAHAYVVVVAAEEPAGLPVERIDSGDKSPAEIRRRLDDLEQQIEDVQAERRSLTRWCMLFVERLNLLEDKAGREEVSRMMVGDKLLFGLEGWVPAARTDEARALAEKHGLAMEIRDPSPDENPPTMMKNRPGLDAGEGLVSFYMTPGYWTWDPSPVVLFSFAVFFAMILADGGYSLLLGLLLLYLWKKLSASRAGRQWRTLLSLLTGASVIYGILVGSYFGVAPSKTSFLGKLAIVNVNDAPTMMAISLIIGVAHVVLANIMNARRMGWTLAALAPLGWALMIIGGFLIPVAGKLNTPEIKPFGMGLASVGALFVLLFTGGTGIIGRGVAGLLAFTKVTGAFGDILSYLRLFALGLAGASLAVAFNDMAKGMFESGVTGIILGVLVLLIGHALNLVLSLSSAVIHGLRLNVIEFFNWGLPEEGSPYRAFAKKERHPWKHGS